MRSQDFIVGMIIVLSVSLLIIVLIDLNDHYKIFDKINIFSKKENFTLVDYSLNYCRSCGWKNRLSCRNCTNCGFCITANGVGSCVSGDENGPYFRQDCAVYEYSKPSLYQYPQYPYSYNYPYYYNYNNVQDAVSDYMDENYNYRYPGRTRRNVPRYRRRDRRDRGNRRNPRRS